MPRRRSRGFSVVEALMAFFILSTAIVVAFSVTGQIVKGTALSESHVRAAAVAHGLLNQQRAVGYPSAVGGSGTVSSSYAKDGVSRTQQMLYNVGIEQIATDTKRITATVTWQESTGSKQVVLQTVVTNI